MNGMSSCHHRLGNYKTVTLSELSSSNQTDADTSNLDFFASLPKETVCLIISMLDPLNCWQLAKTSRSFRNFFIYTVAYLSSNPKADPDLARLYVNFCNRFTYSNCNLIPQFLILNNTIQPMDRQQNMPPMDGLIVDCSKDLPLLNLPELSPLLISWPNYESFQEAIKHSMEQISKVLKSHKHLKVRRLVLKNLIYFPKLVEFLLEKFNGLEYLNIASFNFNHDSNLYYDAVSISKHTALKKVEVTFPISHSFSFKLSALLGECTVNTLQQEPEDTVGSSQTIDASECRLLKSLIFNRDPQDFIPLFLNYPLISCVETLKMNTHGKVIISFKHSGINWYSNLIIIHVSKYDKYPFLIKSSDGVVSLNENLCPKCTEFGLFDESGELHIIWKRQ